MSSMAPGARSNGPQYPTPWSCAGGPDHDHSNTERNQRLAVLTDPRLAVRARAVDPRCELDYEQMIRLLDLVWECRDDGAVNVTGYRCSRCGTTRANSARTSEPPRNPAPFAPGSVDPRRPQ